MAHGGTVRQCELELDSLLPWIDSPFAPSEEYALAKRLLRSRTSRDFEITLETVIKRAAGSNKNKSGTRRSNTSDRRAPKPSTIRKRLGALYRKIKPTLQKGAAVAGSAVVSYGVDRLLDHLVKALGHEVGWTSPASRPVDRALLATRQAGSAARELVSLPDTIPAQLAVEIAIRRARKSGPTRRGSARRPGRSGSSTSPGGPPWWKHPLTNENLRPAGAAFATSIDGSPGGAPAQADVGDWSRPGGDVIMLFHCSHGEP